MGESAALDAADSEVIATSKSGFNTLAFGEIKPYSGSLKDGRLDLVYYQDPGFRTGGSVPFLDSALKDSNRSRPRRPPSPLSLGDGRARNASRERCGREWRSNGVLEFPASNRFASRDFV